MRLVEMQDSAATVDLSVLADRLIDEMVAGGVPEPLTQQITLGAVLDDLFRLIETPASASITALMGA